MKSRLEYLGDIAKIIQNSSAGGKSAGEKDDNANMRCVIENGKLVRTEKDRAQEVTFLANISPLTSPCVLTSPETGQPMAVFPAVYIKIEGSESAQDPDTTDAEDDNEFDFRLLLHPVSALGLYVRLAEYFDKLGLDMDQPFEDIADDILVRAKEAAQEMFDKHGLDMKELKRRQREEE